MRILIFNWRDPKNPKSGGAEIVTLEHAKYWVEKGHQVTWFASLFPQAKATDALDGVTIVRAGSSLGVYLRAPFYYLKNRREFDVVIDEIHGLPFLTPFYVRKPKIAFIHEVAGEIWDYMYPFPINLLGKLYESIYFLFYKSIKFWTDAPSTIDDLVAKGIPKQNCIAIPCPTNIKALTKLPKKEKDPVFIFVSRIVKMKGIEQVIEAFSTIVKELPTAKLWIVGSGDETYVQSLKKRVSGMGLTGRVDFKGRVSEEKKIDLLRRSHLLLHASIKEGWGIVVIEAASQATPAIVYNVSGLKDSVKNGRTGVILKKNSPEEMAKEAVSLWSSPKRYRQMQENTLSYSKKINWKGVTEESNKLINSV